MEIGFNSHRMQKCYILLITCSSTRVIHLEVTCDVNATSLVLALRRFISRKGIPLVIFSDNFKSFKASNVKNFVEMILLPGSLF